MKITREPSVVQEGDRLRGSAQASLLWGGGFTIFRDIAQFCVMLVLVRLLSPADYGTAALAQAIIGMAGVISFQTFSRHALQARDPGTVDWQTLMSVAIRLNSGLALLTVLLASALWFIDDYRSVAWPLAALALVFVLEIPGTLRMRMLEAHHQWKRFRILLALGTLLGLGAGLLIALLGGGVWALVIQPILFGIPAAYDLLVVEKFRPNLSWNKDSWKKIRMFGLNRVGSASADRARVLSEGVLLSAVYSLATLGVFSRASGLAMLLVGRLGPVVMMSLHPVITRAEQGSERFQRLSGLLLRGVTWTTIPIAAVLAITSADVVHLLYGNQWDEVIPLLPLAAAMIVGISILGVLSALLVANDDFRIAFWMDLATGLSAIALAFWLINISIESYLLGLALHGLVFVLIALVILQRHRVIAIGGIMAAFLPALLATGLATLAVTLPGNAIGWAQWVAPLRLGMQFAIFGLAYVLVLRIFFSGHLREQLDVAPGGSIAARMLIVRL